jgi:hypothetical protein
MSSSNLGPMELIREFDLGQEEINSKLEEYVVNELNKAKAMNHPLRHSNIGGWHSDRNLHAKLGDGSPLSILLIQLLESFSNPINHYVNSCHQKFNTVPSPSYIWDYTGVWFNVAFQGSYNSPHIHSGSQISAAYYIRTEQPVEEHPFSGRIDFIYNNLQYGHFPKPGTLILFPSDMLHWVHPYYGNGLRICLSFNINNIHP